MTTRASIPDQDTTGAGISSEISSRIRRGISLYSGMHQAIETPDAVTYRIPSSTGSGFYRVILKETGESCNCADKRGHDLGICKHIAAALIADSKRPAYRIRKKDEDLFELLEKRAGIEEVIGWGTCPEVYWMKWALENPEWEVV